MEVISLGKRLKVFIISFGLVFVMAALPHLLHRGVIISPQIQKSSYTQVHSKLTKIRNEGFGINLSHSIIPSVQAQSDYEGLNSYLVLDFDTGDVLLEKNSSQREEIASLTKLMTAVVSLDLLSTKDTLNIPSSVTGVEPTNLGLIPGQEISVEELLNGMLLTSANDAAEVLKSGVDQKYGEGTFVRAMNDKANIVGLKNTHFDNPQGFDSSANYSTAQDLATLTHYAFKNYSLIPGIVKKSYQFYPASSLHKQIDMYNWNGLLGVYPGVLGVKIGNTDAAKYTTIVLSKRADKNILAVSLGAPGVMERDLWTSELLDSGFGKFNLPAVNISQSDLESKYSTWKYWN